jgi:ribosomal protein S18 acetylase RimI-like enzyme
VAVQTRQFASYTSSPNVLDLRHFSGADLRPLIEAEADEWDRDLHWNYAASAEMILRYADSRILPGYALLESGKVTAYSFFVYEGSKAVVGDCFANPVTGNRRVALQQQLLSHVIETLQQTPGITRIEAQLLLQQSGILAQPFEQEGFGIHRRLFMSIPTRKLFDKNGSKRAAGVRFHNWQESDFQPASNLITRSYADHVDSLINDQYRTASGSLRFLNNIVRFPGCGSFEATASIAAVDEGTGQMVGLILASRVRSDVGHITQVCLLPSFRGKGLGRLLLALSAEQMAALGAKNMTLTVTEENTQAVDLYLGLGFAVERTFDAFVWES